MIDKEKARECTRRLALSRVRLLQDFGFFGLLLACMGFTLDETMPTAATDGRRIYFNPAFLEQLTDDELDFVMMHEILHIVLKHVFRYGDRESERFNIACDIVVNSNIMLERGVTVPVMIAAYPAMHLAPDGKEGHLYTAEQVYDMLPPMLRKNPKFSGGSFDCHGKWQKLTEEERQALLDDWDNYIRDAAITVEIQNSSDTFRFGSLMARRVLKELRKSKLDWRQILNNFVQEEICDYSFTPPDRRFDGGDFFLPDFNEKEETIKNIWFVVDTSGSVSDDQLTAAYGEMVSSIEQFNGRLEGRVSFFEGSVTEPIAFSSVEDIKAIRPVGGCGTDIEGIFKFMPVAFCDQLPSCAVIITDGYGKFPKEDAALGIPVLWLINNDEVTPSWGKIARIKKA